MKIRSSVFSLRHQLATGAKIMLRKIYQNKKTMVSFKLPKPIERELLNDIGAEIASKESWLSAVSKILYRIPLDRPFTRQWFLNRYLKTLVQMTGSNGKTPDQTVSEVFQQIRDAPKTELIYNKNGRVIGETTIKEAREIIEDERIVLDSNYLNFVADGIYVLCDYPEPGHWKAFSKYRGERLVARALDKILDNRPKTWAKEKKAQIPKINAFCRKINVEIDKENAQIREENGTLKKGQIKKDLVPRMTPKRARKHLGYDVSRTETQLRECNYITQARLPGMESKKTENPLRLDFLFFRVKNGRKQWFAIEFQGEQHRKVVQFWGGYKGLIYRQECDHDKASHCVKHDVILICVQSYDYKTIMQQIKMVLDDFDSTDFETPVKTRKERWSRYYWNFNDTTRIPEPKIGYIEK